MGRPQEHDDSDEFIDLDNPDENLDGVTEEEDLDYGDEVIDAPEEEVVTPPDDKGSPVVPHARFHEVNEALKAANAELERLRQQPGTAERQATPQVDVNAELEQMIAQHTELMYSGEQDEAAKLMMQILKKEREQAVSEAMINARAEVSAEREVAEWQQTCVAVVRRYPMLADGENQNAEALAETQAWTRFFQSEAGGNMPRIEAVQMAADKVCPMYGAEPERPRTQTRKVDAVKRNIADSQRIPPTARGGMGERGRGSNLDISDMTDEELAKLPESEKAKIRGDFV